MNEINNHYLKIKKSDQAKIHNPGYKKHLLTTCFKMMIIGKTNSGKTNALYEILSRSSKTYTRIILVCRNPNQDLYDLMIKKCPDIEVIIVENGTEIPLLEDDGDRTNKLIIFDDCFALKNQDAILDWFIRSRHLNWSAIYLSQSFISKNPDFKRIRLQCNYFILLKMSSLKDLKIIINDFPIDNINEQQFIKYYKEATKEPLNFLLIDIDKDQLRHNLLKILN